VWCLPTYRRPEQCAAVLKCIIAVGCSTPGIVIVNGTDDIEEYQKIKLPDQWKMVVLPQNIGCCGAMNWAFHNYPDEPFYGLICDDEFIYSAGWDKRLTEAAGTKYISHANDKWQSGKRIHCYATFGGDLIREIGYWAIPGLWHWFFDDQFENIANNLNIVRYCEDVIGEHKHYLAGKTKKDDTYKAGESRNGMDHMIFQRWMLNDYPALKRRLVKFYEKEIPNG
jgi:hypothetical protein